MKNLTRLDFQKLKDLAHEKAEKLENYLSVLCVEDDDDKDYISEHLAEIVFYQNLRDKVQTILNEQ
jgi:hypothetical protein